METDDTPRTLKTVETTVNVIRELKRMNGATITELAEELDLSKGGVYNHLATLRKHRLVVQNGNTYDLSLHVAALGEHVKNNSKFYQAGYVETENIAHSTGEYAHLMAVEYGRGIHLHQARGESAVGKKYHDLNPQKPDYLHYTATGKAVLSHYSREHVERIIDRWGLPEMTENTITDEEELFTELEKTRERGYSINDEEELIGICALGAPIRNLDDEIIGAISVSGPVERIKGGDREQELAEKVNQAANVIRLNMGEFERGLEAKLGNESLESLR